MLLELDISKLTSSCRGRRRDGADAKVILMHFVVGSDCLLETSRVWLQSNLAMLPKIRHFHLDRLMSRPSRGWSGCNGGLLSPFFVGN